MDWIRFTFYFFVIVFSFLLIRRYWKARKRSKARKSIFETGFLVKCLCYSCDGLIAIIKLPTEDLYLYKASVDRWNGDFYNKRKLLKKHLILCPDCGKMTCLEKKETLKKIKKLIKEKE